MLNLTESDLEAIQKDSEQGVAPGMGDVQLMVAQIRQLMQNGKNLLVERQALAFLLKRFVDGEHDQDENQAERHMYHDEAQTLLAYLGGNLQGHTLVPDEALRTQHEQIQKLTSDEQEAADLCDRLSDLLRNTAIEVRGPEEPLKRHGFSDLPSRVKTVVSVCDQLKAFAVEMINASFEGCSFDGGDIQDIAVKHGLLMIERREDQCGEVCPCREYGFPAECYRKTSLLLVEDTHER
ncbi:hypothetical protein [Pseudomonas brenneri]|uniref:hypothetical protein n=1 Tax=Pseudomonas brenneri TaxID=129817 RepID=UPI0028CFE19D|nr:hypothetical protein [Pseudomonas brenneri]